MYYYRVYIYYNRSECARRVWVCVRVMKAEIAFDSWIYFFDSIPANLNKFDLPALELKRETKVPNYYSTMTKFVFFLLYAYFFFGRFSIDEYIGEYTWVIASYVWRTVNACICTYGAIVCVRVSVMVCAARVYVYVCEFVHRESKYIPYALCRVIVSWLCKFKGVIALSIYVSIHKQHLMPMMIRN